MPWINDKNLDFGALVMHVAFWRGRVNSCHPSQKNLLPDLTKIDLHIPRKDSIKIPFTTEWHHLYFALHVFSSSICRTTFWSCISHIRIRVFFTPFIGRRLTRSSHAQFCSYLVHFSHYFFYFRLLPPHFFTGPKYSIEKKKTNYHFFIIL